MKHVRTVSRQPALAQFPGTGNGNTSIAETVVILLLSLFFSDWENFPTVIQNLQKYYQKTP